MAIGFSTIITTSAGGNSGTTQTGVTIVANSLIVVGMSVTGTGITAGTTVNAINGTALTLSVATAVANSTTLSFGFGNKQVVPDKGLARGTAPTVHKVQFGDGYELRVAEGINSIKQQYSISFNNREKAEIDDIVAFLDYKKGVTSFNFTIPDSRATSNDETTIKVVSEQYSLAYTNDIGYGCTATFRRVYEP
jgi:phage-related protein